MWPRPCNTGEPCAPVDSDQHVSQPFMMPAFVLRLSLAQLISWGSVFYLFSLLIEPLERDLGLSRAELSLAFSLGLLAEGLMAYPVGRWIDRGHERAVMTAGSVLAGLCLVLHSVVTGLAGLYAVWTGSGGGHGGHAVLAGFCPGDAALSARLSSRHHHADFLGWPGQHGVYSADGLADAQSWAGAMPCGAGAVALAGVRAAALVQLRGAPVPAQPAAHQPDGLCQRFAATCCAARRSCWWVFLRS